MNAPLAYGCMGLVLAGCAAYAASVLRDRRRDRRRQPVPSPAHDAMNLSDDEEHAFAGLIAAWYQDAS